ncbi:MFS general substrate transporter [Pholiota conissans]|uniref:MFS general substrate transporter n=1 Tax=Pholiota conissans TaxID=109636 RepID=A0A9P6D001_9AGAR|nr:MFS general substrate transporter [Pholiota conissans]
MNNLPSEPMTPNGSEFSEKKSETDGEKETVCRSVSTVGDTLTPPSRGFLNSCVIVLTVTSSMVINTANSTAMGIALPTVEREWALEPPQLQWIMSAYPLSSGCLFLVMGRLADVYGRKLTFSAGSIFLAVMTLGCGFAPNVMTLDILRGIQGIGAAATIPASLGILAHSFPPSRARSLAFATFSAGAPIGAVFGTAVGGVLTEYTAKTWRSSFYLLGALTVLCFIGGLISIDKDVPSEEVDKRIDWVGSFLVTAGLVLIVFVLSQGELAPDKWATPYIIVLLILGVFLIGVFLYWQHYLETVQANPDAPYSIFTPPPLMKLTLWTRANGRFAAMMAIAFANWCAFLAWTFWVQLYYQNYKAYNPMQTVARLLPMFISGLACNVFVGFMASHIPIIYLVATGSLATSLACLLFAVINPDTTYWAYGFSASVISVMGADFVFSAGTLFIARVALPHEQSVAGALFNTMTQLGTAVGVTVTTVVYNNVGENLIPGADVIVMYRAAQWTAFAFGIIATCLGVIFFRGVGVVGFRAPKSVTSESLLSRAEEAPESENKPRLRLLPRFGKKDPANAMTITVTPTSPEACPTCSCSERRHTQNTVNDDQSINLA